MTQRCLTWIRLVACSGLIAAGGAACGPPGSSDAGDAAGNDAPRADASDVLEPRDVIDAGADAGRDATTDAPGEGGADASDAGADASDGGGGDGGDGGDGGVVSGTGFVDIRLVGTGTAAGANFALGATIAPGCMRMVIGACTSIACTTTAGDAGTDGGTTPVVNAGPITVSNATAPTMPTLTLTPLAGGGYNVPMIPTALWSMGDSVAARAPGMTAGVPAFDQMVRAPGAMTLMTPHTASSSPQLTINRAMDLPIAWTGDMGAQVRALFSSSATSGGTTTSATVTCWFPATPAAATVPSAALMTLPVSTTGHFEFLAAGRTNFTSGAFQIELRAARAMTSAAGAGPTAGVADIQ